MFINKYFNPKTMVVYNRSYDTNSGNYSPVYAAQHFAYHRGEYSKHPSEGHSNCRCSYKTNNSMMEPDITGFAGRYYDTITETTNKITRVAQDVHNTLITPKGTEYHKWLYVNITNLKAELNTLTTAINNLCKLDEDR